MNVRHVCCQFGIIIGILAQSRSVAAGVAIEEPRGQVYGMLDRIERIEYDESDPVREDFDWGRMSATHLLLGCGVKPRNGWYYGGIVGPGTTELHSGEGQTVEYDTLLIGAEGAYYRSLPMVQGLGVVASMRYFITLSDDGDITEVARDTVTDGGRTELTWNELMLGVAATMDYDILRFKAGVEYIRSDIAQKWTFSDGRESSDSTLSPEQDFGLRFGTAWMPSEVMEIELDMTIGHRAAFRGGVSYRF